MHRCFARGAPTHTDGEWRAAESQTRPYRMRAADMQGVGHEHVWGECAGDQPLYEWVPRRCVLQSRKAAVANVCSKLAGRTVLFVGDSVGEQIFFSFVHLLGANFSRHSTIWTEARSGSRKIGTVRSKDRVEVRACDGALRVQSIRNDLLIWSATKDDGDDVSELKAHPLLTDFRNAVRNADLVVLGGGHHFQNFEPPFFSFMRSAHGAGKLGAAGLRWETFFAGNLEHTVSSIINARREAGLGTGREAVLILSPTRPVPSCWEHELPIDVAARRAGKPLGTFLRQALVTDEKTTCVSSRTRGCGNPGHGDPMYFAVQWKGFGTYRNVSRAIARKAGVAYLDFFPLSALRPDAAVAKHVPFPKNSGVAGPWSRPGRRAA